MRETGLIVVLVGPSGSGKTAVAENFEKLTTCTTRDPREGEINGIHYNFFTHEKFVEMLHENCFVEYSEYAGNLYGTRFEELDKALTANKEVVIVMDVNGAKAIKERYPNNSISIFLDRNKYDLIMAILERKISNEEKTKRIIQLDEDDKAREHCDYVVKNEILTDTINNVRKIMSLN